MNAEGADRRRPSLGGEGSEEKAFSTEEVANAEGAGRGAVDIGDRARAQPAPVHSEEKAFSSVGGLSQEREEAEEGCTKIEVRLTGGEDDGSVVVGGGCGTVAGEADAVEVGVGGEGGGDDLDIWEPPKVNESEGVDKGECCCCCCCCFCCCHYPKRCLLLLLPHYDEALGRIRGRGQNCFHSPPPLSRFCHAATTTTTTAAAAAAAAAAAMTTSAGSALMGLLRR